MNHLNRLLLCVPLLAFSSVACGDAGDAVGTGGTGNGSGSGAVTAGAASTTGGAGNTAGTGVVAIPLAGSGQAVGGGDQGMLFSPDGSVPIMPPDTAGTGSGGGAPSIPGDGNVAKSTLEGSIKGTATFTQVGVDVQIVVDLTSGCADGNHRFTIHDGGSCDSDATDGNPWSPRGTELGSDIKCSGGKGKLEYTRKGDDKTKNLTVGDHNTDTDLTAHVVIVSDEKDLNSRASCGNFFF
jgi:hypothetical protein